MGLNLFEKIVKRHLVSGELNPGSEISIAIDQTLTEDPLGTMAYLQFEAMGVPRVKTRLSVSYVDHCLLQEGFENPDDHRYLQTVAAKYGILFSKPGNGICHQVHLERFSCPGETLIGADSHTPTCGAVGMLAMGVGGLDVAVAMAGGPFFLSYPQVVRINLHGRLKPWSTAKDIILEILRTLTTKGNVGKVLEFGGEGITTLSVPERATIANMGAELGVTTSLFPSDAVTRRFFAAQGRLVQWRELLPDADAEYDETIDIALATIDPNVARPHSPDNVCKVRDVGRLKVDQVLIGSCTNSSFRDLMIAASMLKGRQVHPDVSFGVAAGSRQVLRMIAENGALSDIIDSGARILETACGFCAGYGQAPQSGGVSVRTSNRNFEGRSGTKDAQVYLVSPEVAVATALTGELTDPNELGMEPPVVPVPEKFFIDDRLVLPPSAGDIKVYRGPNISDPPHQTPLPDHLRAGVAIKLGDKITTDHIIPAGPVSRYRSNIPKSSDFIFHRVDPLFAERCKDFGKKGLASVIVAGWSYGQGSSREHAALCPAYLGVRAVIARSIERIHMANLVNFGILPLIFTDSQDYEKMQLGDGLEIQNINQALNRTVIQVKNLSRDYLFEVSHCLTPRQVEMIRRGGLLNLYGAHLPR
ncbi:MAG: aconitate hydratase [Deltaproteobacteria bacterium]|nr:aconitate hydratase [Deltaproteobacteria bacterium]